MRNFTHIKAENVIDLKMLLTVLENQVNCIEHFVIINYAPPADDVHIKYLYKFANGHGNVQMLIADNRQRPSIYNTIYLIFIFDVIKIHYLCEF